MQMKRMVRFLFLAGQDLEVTVFGMRIGDTRRIGRTSSVGDEYLIACALAQHPHAVGTLLFGKGLLRFNIRTIKEIHYNSDSLRRSAFSATWRASMTPCMSPSMKAARL